MGSNSNMIPATQEDKDAFQQGMLSNYSKGMIKDIEPYAYDPIPAVNAKGGRNVDGWRSVFVATVQKGVSSAWPLFHSAVLFCCPSPAFLDLLERSH